MGQSCVGRITPGRFRYTMHYWITCREKRRFVAREQVRTQQPGNSTAPSREDGAGSWYPTDSCSRNNWVGWTPNLASNLDSMRGDEAQNGSGEGGGGGDSSGAVDGHSQAGGLSVMLAGSAGSASSQGVAQSGQQFMPPGHMMPPHNGQMDANYQQWYANCPPVLRPEQDLCAAFI